MTKGSKALFSLATIFMIAAGAFYAGTQYAGSVNADMLTKSYTEGQENIASVATIVRDADQEMIKRQKIEIETLSRYCKK